MRAKCCAFAQTRYDGSGDINEASEPLFGATLVALEIRGISASASASMYGHRYRNGTIADRARRHVAHPSSGASASRSPALAAPGGKRISEEKQQCSSSSRPSFRTPDIWKCQVSA